MSLPKVYACLILFIAGCLPAFAQDECETALNRATEEFNAGHLHGIPAMLSGCIDRNQNREWRQRAYILLAETYLLLEDPFGSEKSYLEILKANPEFVTDEKRDPIDLVYLGSKFTATPIFSLHARAGSNVSIIHTVLDRSASDDSDNQRNLLRPGFQFGGGIDWNYNERLSLSLEGNYVFSAYKQHISGIFGRDVVEAIDRQSWVKVPLSVKYSDDKGKYRPYGYLGVSVDFLLGDRISILYSDRNLDPSTPEGAPPQTINQDRESPVLKFSPKRNFLNRSWMIGGGVKYKVDLNYVFIDLRYSFGMTNLVDADNSIYDYRKLTNKTSAEFQNEAEAALRWGYIDDLFRMDHLYLSIGYIHPLYKPRKLKKARSKSVMRTIKKQEHEGTSN